MPSVEDIIQKNKSKKKSAATKASAPKGRANVAKSTAPAKPEKKKLADFDPFGVKFVSEYKNSASSSKPEVVEEPAPEKDIVVEGRVDVSTDNAADTEVEAVAKVPVKKSKPAPKKKVVAKKATAAPKPVVQEEKAEKVISEPKTASPVISAVTDLPNEDLETTTSDNASTDIRLSTKQEIIYNLLRKHRNPETLITPVVKSSDLSKILEMSETSLRKQIQRMEQKGAIKRNRHISGPDGGTSYVVYDVEKETNSFLTELTD